MGFNVLIGKKGIINDGNTIVLNDTVSKLSKSNTIDNLNKEEIDAVFLIHGHNEAKKLELRNLLQEKFGLRTIILSEQPNNGDTIIQKFEKVASKCKFAFALFTPDDVVNKGDDIYLQARPNVIFELGWFYAKIGRENVCIIEQENKNFNIFSDINGILTLRFRDSVKEIFLDIEAQLKSSGVIK